MKKVINSFRYEHGFLSNFYESSIYIDGEQYKSVEHAYQAHKTLDPVSRRLIRTARTPAEAKALGKCVQLRLDWEDVKYELMLQFIRKKFENPFLRPLLLATGDAELVMDNFWGDRTWGVYKGEGQNQLGQILMRVRDEIALSENCSPERSIFNDDRHE